MVRRIAIGTMLLAATFMVTATADDAAGGEEKFSAKCPISGQAAKEDQNAEYKEGKVYFCCKNCKAAFAKDSKKHAVKSNAQLVATGQYVQKKCPFSGGPLKSEATKIGGVGVKFCCNNCKGKAEKVDGDDQLALAFSEKAFKKAFEKKKDDEG